MKTVFSIILGVVMVFGVSACQVGLAQSLIPATATVRLVETSTPTLLVTPGPSMPAASTTVATVVSSSPRSTIDIAELKAVVGYSIREPITLPDGYVLESATVDEPTRSVCLQYRYHHPVFNSVLFIAQGPVTLAPPLALIPGWPEYAILSETVRIGGAENSSYMLGWRRTAWACTEAAEIEKTPFSYALAPRLTWDVDHQQFDLYSASGGCGTPGGLTTLDILRVAEGLTGNSTHAADELDPDCLRSIADAGKLAGFNVKEPAYLPKDVSFYFATYEKTPSPSVILRFFDEQYSDMGTFIQINQQTEADPSYVTSCNESPGDVCEILQIGTTPVVYRYSADGASGSGTEQMDWYADGFFFSLFRNAGEPGKVYKDELVKIVGSLK